MTMLWRMIIFGAQNFWRNIWLSLVTVIIVMLNLFLMSVVMGVNVVGQQTLTAVKQKINLSVYFTATTPEQRVEEIREELLQKPEVASIKLISRAEHLEILINSQQNSDLIKDAVEQLGDNPLGAGLVITAKTLEGYGAISKSLEDAKYQSIIEDTGNDYETNQNVINRLSLYVQRIQTATLWLTALFALITFMMVFNTIRVNIYSHREEIGIMKLVGATDAFVRGPFIISSIMYGLLASVLTTAVLIPVLSLVNPFFAQLFAGYDINVLGYFREHLLAILGIEIAVGCTIAATSSILAIGRYLRV